MHVVILCEFEVREHKASRRGDADRAQQEVTMSSSEHRLTDCPTASAIDVLLVGGPTHAHGASAATQDDACRAAEGVARGARTATFDTRIDMPKILTGSAAVSATKLLKRAGATFVTEPRKLLRVTGQPADPRAR